METIRTYVENIFTTFPKTERSASLKREILAGMEEKYNDLIREGKSEHEAVGSVIANFGSIEEITAELGIEQITGRSDNSLYVSNEEAFEYLDKSKSSGVKVGLGVWLILAGVAGLVLIDGVTNAPDAVGVAVLLISIAAAVGLFIFSGIGMERYEVYEETEVRLDPKTKEELKQQAGSYLRVFAIKIILGVSLIILAVIGVVIINDLPSIDIINIYNYIRLSTLESASAAGLLFTIGLSVFLFVTACYTKGAYDVLLNEGEYSYKKQSKKSERLIGTIAAVYWPLATAIFLAWGFGWDAWDRSWIIWPVAGVLFGAIAGGISVWYSGKD